MSSNTRNVVSALDDMLSEIGAAAEKSAAEANTEPGGYQGGTEHPSADVDDRTDDAQEGSRSSENTSDVKEDQGAPSVENTTPGTPGGQDSVTLNIGTQSAATGEDSSVETDSAKGGKDDPGTQRGSSTHPARTDNDSLDGHKYANLIEKAGALEQVGRELVAAVAVAADGDVQKRAQELAKASEEGDGEPEGSEKGASEGDPAPESSEKDASDEDEPAPPPEGTVEDADQLAKRAEVVTDIAYVVQDAFDMADKTASYLANLAAAEKEAADSDPNRPEGEQDGSSSGKSDDSGEPSDDSSDDSGGGEGGGEPAPPFGGGGEAPPVDEGGPPPEAGGAPPGLGAGGPPPEAGGAPPPAAGGGALDEQSLLSALAGGGDIGAPDAVGGMMGAGGPPPEAGGAPPMPGMEGGAPPMPGMEDGAPPMGGGAPPMGGGAPPMPGMEGGDPMAMGGPSEEDLMILLQALQAAGVSPEEFEAAIAQKAAQAVKERQVKESGTQSNWQPKTAAEAARLQETIKFVREVCGK
jgi:hypothetical protein